jgi:hypothetical protein
MKSMLPSAKLLLLAALLGAGWASDIRADPKTVCSITVNSPDEQAVFRRSLSPEKFRFVELVERGRPDWLASACRQQIRCDVLVISGHFDGRSEFFSDRVEASEFLPVDELERVSCSDSCPGLFSQLKEVYLFGCNTLNVGAQRSASAEIERSLVRSGHSPADAERVARMLGVRHGESSRDRMRQIFMNVPAIYGFSAVAPVGPVAASLLGRHFHADGTADVGSGRPSSRLIGHFAGHPMVVTTGLTEKDPQAEYRRDMCQFADDRRSAAQKIAFVHQILGREMAEVRMFLDSIEEYMASLPEADRQVPAVAGALDEIARDLPARSRYLDFARDADQPAVRVRMLKLALSLGWLSPAELRAELMQMIAQQLARSAIHAADVDLVCALNADRQLDQELHRLELSPVQASKAGHAGVLACLGSAEARTRVLEALYSSDDRDVEIAQVYLYHRPITDVVELRAASARVASMTASPAQIRAIDALARHNLSDREAIAELTRLFPRTASLGVQTAIAGALIRADRRAFATPELAQALRHQRIKAPQGEDLIDALIRRLQTP